MSDETPRHLGRYELLFRIAAGGMAEVWAARVMGEAGFQKLLAIKRMLPNIAEDDDFVTMFLDEARVAANISSPHVVQTLDLGRAEDGSLFIVMELVVGAPLSQLSRSASKSREPVPLGVAVELISQASQGLHDAHEATTPAGVPLEIVHRDVSPQNILAGLDGRVRLTDFGVARAVARMTHTEGGQIKGKFAYSSPEQLRGGAHLDRRSDVFALATVAWELLTTQRLFLGDTPIDTMERVKAMPIPLVSQVRGDVPADIANVIAWGLERDVSKRTPTARAFGEALVEGARRHMPMPGRDAMTAFVKAHGGESLQKIQSNIRKAVSAISTAPDGESIAVRIEPSEPSAPRVRSDVSRGTDRLEVSQPSLPQPDASGPQRSPGSLLPAPPPPAPPPPAPSKVPLFVAAGLLGVLGIAGVAYVVTRPPPALEVQQLPETPGSVVPAAGAPPVQAPSVVEAAPPSPVNPPVAEMPAAPVVPAVPASPVREEIVAAPAAPVVPASPASPASPERPAARRSDPSRAAARPAPAAPAPATPPVAERPATPTRVEPDEPPPQAPTKRTGLVGLEAFERDLQRR